MKEMFLYFLCAFLCIQRTKCFLCTFYALSSLLISAWLPENYMPCLEQYPTTLTKCRLRRFFYPKRKNLFKIRVFLVKGKVDFYLQ